ncbi:DUF2793 domain-containing protein [Microbulbifer sp. THAF38]|uniref:DUF2793 domain-containing protein n=1 Tax=Microbulbifer sp. THAF38 TaxID=2587856 RepID=UPI0012695A07|nr:DUF2793 domain-containing protein [Microbulbifer sp. THAF38]QFT57114.1 hypothetical protein FIU95_21415 [Microbulbifer sp. THAF38]
MDIAGALLQLEVQAIQNDPPASDSDGNRYLVAASIGAWSGKDGQLTSYVATPGYWRYFPGEVDLNKAGGLLYVKGNIGWQIANRPAAIWLGWWGRC